MTLQDRQGVFAHSFKCYQMFSRSDAALMVDSVFPADDRLTFPDAGHECGADQGQPFDETEKTL